MDKQQIFKLKVNTQQLLSDTVTPVSIYLKVRDKFSSTILLESTDYHSRENCFSFICMQPIASFSVQNKQLQIKYPDGTQHQQVLTKQASVPKQLQIFSQQLQADTPTSLAKFNGLFGHTNYDAIQYFDTITLNPAKRKQEMPDLHYALYRYIIAINHFNDELFIIENSYGKQASAIERIKNLIQSQQLGTFSFRLRGEESSNLSDQAFMDLVTAGKKHCQLGDVFQIVFSRQFRQKFQGDDFNVYRVLRSVNPSPYLFYFDYGNYKIFGSSPEAQMVIQNGLASVNPIAGTYKRTGKDEEDRIKAQELATDPKENAEHVMLVDLARNDLSRNTKNVKVAKYCEVQYFSHVIHLVSKVQGQLNEDTNPIQIFSDTFPAGTLSGAPKYKAMQLIDQYEQQNRATYGGAIGYIGFDGNMNQAIVIRSFLSSNNTLYYQAGAGIVNASQEEKELQEVNNKLAALKRALLLAEKI